MSFLSLLKRIFSYEKYMTEQIARRVGEIEVYLDANYHPVPESEPEAVSAAEEVPEEAAYSAEEPSEDKIAADVPEEATPSPERTASRDGGRYSIVRVEEDDKPRSNVRYSITCGHAPTHGADLDYERLLRNHLDEIVGQNRGSDVLKTVRSAPLQTFVEYLRCHIYRQGLTGPQVYRAAQIDKRLYSKIISNTHYNPSRETAIALAFATHLALDDAKTLLSRAGYTLSEANRRDLILIYFFQNKSWNLIEINGVLDAFGEQLIGRG